MKEKGKTFLNKLVINFHKPCSNKHTHEKIQKFYWDSES